MARKSAATAVVAVAACLLLACSLASTAAATGSTSTAATVRGRPRVAGGSSGGSSELTVSTCSKPDGGCVRCTQSGGKSSRKTTCTECSTDGPITPDLIQGICFCPEGTGRFGSPNTVPDDQFNKRVAGTHGGGGSGGYNGPPVGCALCTDGAYSAAARPVKNARCYLCPTDTDSVAIEGSNTCLVSPGFIFNAKTRTVEVCPVDFFCEGGDFKDVGRVKQACPQGSTTQMTTGNSQISDCKVPPGKYVDSKGAIVDCPKASFCEGGNADPEDAGKAVATPCDSGQTTAGTGASSKTHCFACTAPTILCGVNCANPTNDPNNCKTCDTKCPAQTPKCISSTCSV